MFISHLRQPGVAAAIALTWSTAVLASALLCATLMMGWPLWLSILFAATLFLGFHVWWIRNLEKRIAILDAKIARTWTN